MPCTASRGDPTCGHIKCRRTHVPGTDLRPAAALTSSAGMAKPGSRQRERAVLSRSADITTRERRHARARLDVITPATSAAAAAPNPAGSAAAFRSVRCLPTASSTSPRPRASSSHSTVTLAVRSGATIRRQARRPMLRAASRRLAVAGFEQRRTGADGLLWNLRRPADRARRSDRQAARTVRRRGAASTCGPEQTRGLARRMR